MVAGEQKAKEFGIESNEVLLDIQVGPGEYFLSRRGAIYQVLEWLSPPSGEGRTVHTLQWASGNPQEVVDVPEPDGNICIELDITFTPPEVVWVIGEDMDDLLGEDVQQPEEEKQEEGEFNVGGLEEEAEEELSDDLTQAAIQEQVTEAKEEGAIAEEEPPDKPLGKREWIGQYLEKTDLPIKVCEVVAVGVTDEVWDSAVTAEKTITRYMEQYAKDNINVIFEDNVLKGAGTIFEEAEPAPIITPEKAAEVLGLDVGLQLVINIPKGVDGEKLESIMQTVEDAVGGE